MRLSLHELDALAREVLTAAGVAPSNAAAVATALVAAEADGIASHGMARLPFYAAQATSGKVDGYTPPRLEHTQGAALSVDAAHGFAFPALALAADGLAAAAREHGIAGCTVRRSHHAGVLAHVVEPLARAGLMALACSNTPAAMAPPGGRTPLLGTNPLAFAAPRTDGDPVLIDLSLSQVARGKVVQAARRGEAIPPDWALDAEGRPTTDPTRALAGSMAPLGGSKGAALAMVIELLCAALGGANFAWQASSFFSAEGAPPGVGQFLLAIDPAAFHGVSGCAALTATLCAAIEREGAAARVPGARRFAARARARRDGVEVADELIAELRALAQ